MSWPPGDDQSGRHAAPVLVDPVRPVAEFEAPPAEFEAPPAEFELPVAELATPAGWPDPPAGSIDPEDPLRIPATPPHVGRHAVVPRPVMLPDPEPYLVPEPVAATPSVWAMPPEPPPAGHPLDPFVAWPALTVAPATPADDPGEPAPASGRGRRLAAAGAAASVVLALVALVGIRALDRAVDGAADAGLPEPASVRDGCGPAAAPATLPAALTRIPAARRPVMTPDAADDVVAALWQLREAAISACDTAAIKRLETGSAEPGDLARIACDCRVRETPAAFDAGRTFVPRQTRFPAYFVAEVATMQKDGDRWTEVLVVTRASAGTPWQVALDTGYRWTGHGGHAPGGPRVDDEGFAVPASAGARAGARADLAALAAYWQRAKRTGDVAGPARLAAGYWTTQKAGRMALHRSGDVQDNDLVGDYTWKTSPDDPLYAFATSSGATFACGVIDSAVGYRAESGGVVTQDGARRSWGQDVAPGGYATMSGAGTAQTCLLIPRTGKAEVLGGDEASETAYVAGEPGKA